MNDITRDEEEFLLALRRARSASEPPLPTITPNPGESWSEAFVRLLRTRVAVSESTSKYTVRSFLHVTERYGGPRVRVDGTLRDLQDSWQAHQDDLIMRGKGADALRHHREAVARYCRALEIPWVPEKSVFEKRGRRARRRRKERERLPGDWLEKCRELVHDVEWHKNPHVDAMFRARIRLLLRTGPREPSEGARLKLTDITWPTATRDTGSITYGMTKVAGPEGLILVPRIVYGIPRHVLTAPTRKSLKWYLDNHRAPLVANAPGGDHGHVYCGPNGTPADAEWFRNECSQRGKAAWAPWHPYLGRKIAFTVHLLEILDKYGHYDLERFVQWTSHDEVDVAREYTALARDIIRDAGESKNALRDILNAWSRV